MTLPVDVWAPHATRVELITDDGRSDMSAEDNGWFTASLPAGTRYSFSLDGGPARPDPRSAFQPEGVHGPSEVVDAAAYAWHSGAEIGIDALTSVMYELHVGTFTEAGTLRSAIERLDHLADLGITMIELMPIAAFPGKAGWGYDGVGLWAVHEAYGGPTALQEFVDAAHTRGIGVCLDVVYNHLGPSGNYLAEFGPYFTYAHHTPWGQAINLDGPGSRHVRDFIIDSALRWFTDFRIDALRLDAVHALIDDSEYHLLAELSDRVDELREETGRPLRLIAESDLNDVTTITPTRRGGYGMDAQWDDDIHHALHAWLTGERHGYYADFGESSTLAKALTEVFVHNGTFSSFRGKHWGTPVPADVDPRRFVAFTENHDQVGNRGMGDRPSERLPAPLVAGGAALLLLSPFTPMLFMGQEWSASTPFPFFTDYAENELAHAIREGRRREFAEHGWTDLYGPDAAVPDPQDPATVTSAVLPWDERETGIHARMLAWFTSLIALRRETFGDGETEHVITPSYGDHWFAMRRGPLIVILNRGEDPETIEVADGHIVQAFTADDTDATTTRTDVTVPARSSVILRIGAPTPRWRTRVLV
ncbi:malto-oligosyltrehalose trehalohydrolase [Bowdeniella nasicola]|uniref:Malto-oligosyltrehalose trehalohydrolase n=1 Tax=Bowdeniella nasicola TaxID=208480 RepID=A0A1Q5Q542_9ACTO|nr:malto-oligosyltrehalose trehalohydrolase [Bowdeniella nasicola]OKL54903.1 malto-oligosyltrehalose trehalohydrolase [Bowdeniella nasicola]